MRSKVWVVGVALASGCAMFGGSQESKKSETRTQQDQAQQSLQRAADAQKKAADEQAKVEQARQEVTQKQKELADAQAKLRGQTAKAEQAQRDAQEATRLAHQEASQQQQQALQTQRSENQQTSSQQQKNQAWTQEQSASGTVVQAGTDQVQMRTQDKDLMKLLITDSTAVTLNGQTASAAQLPPGSDLRASYQMVDGQPKALKIDATSKSSSSTQEPQQQK
jgi:hypothetical protein